MTEKNNLRSNLLKHNILNDKLSDEIGTKLQQLVSNRVVCTYIPLDSEINILPALSNTFQMNTTFMLDDELQICSYGAPFIKQQNGILEPENKIIRNDTEVFIVPGVAFTKFGSRLGRGGGHYDVLLKKYPNALKIGICHDFQLIKDIPLEEHDIPMDYVLTNINYYKSSI